MVEAVQCDWRTAPVSDRLKAALAFIEKLVTSPADLDAEDLAAARSAGLSDDEIEDAAQVCVLFTTLVRLADTFDFALPPQREFDDDAPRLLSMGYRFPPPLMWLIQRRGRG